MGLDGQGPLQVRADRLASQVDEADWADAARGTGPRGPGCTTGPSWRYGP